MSARAQPQAGGSEEALLGCLLLRGRWAYREAGWLRDAMFFDPRHRIVFAAIAARCERGAEVDPVLVFDELGARAASVGGLSFLGDLLAGVPTSDNVRWYADEVRRAYALRRIATVASEIAARALRYDYDPVQALAAARTRLADLADELGGDGS
jgi:replicative DNA helicase